MKKLRVGLNGFGRIGRAITRIASTNPAIDIVAINTAHSTPPSLAYALQYDSVYRMFQHEVTADEQGIAIAGKHIDCSRFADPLEIPWGESAVDVVVDCSGVFKTRLDLQKHLRESVKQVILTVPTDDESITHVVLGVNDEITTIREADILSNCSCTTNCAAILVKVLHDTFGVKTTLFSTTHAYTSSQSLADETGDKPTRARAAGLSIVPTTTGASKTISKVIPEIHAESIAGVAFRVPTPVGSITDMNCLLNTKCTVEDIHAAFMKAAKGPLANILAYQTVPLVSADYIGSPYSCTYDANYTQVANGNFVKVLGWYDNEWGYSSRVVDLLAKIAGLR